MLSRKMFPQVVPWPCWSCLGQRGERVNEVPRKGAGCQLGNVTHWQLFPRVLSKETLEKPWALLCQHGETFLEERMCRDWDSKEEAEGRAEFNLGFALLPLSMGELPGCPKPCVD